VLANRLERLPRHRLGGHLIVLEARGCRARTLGLAFLNGLPPERALLIPRCRSVHTFGMRFPIDIVFFDRAGAVVRIVREAPPRRAFSARGAHGVLEASAGQAGRFIAAGPGGLVQSRAR
jgi:uncharacterized membrane protein (UPF0127 family)